MNKGIFFDLYGTLLINQDMKKAWEDWLSTFYECFKGFGLQISKNIFALKCDGFFSNPEPPNIDYKLTIYENRIYSLGKQLGLKLKYSEITETAVQCLNSWHNYVKLDPNTIPVLNKLSENKIIALISNFDHPPHIYEILSGLKLRKFFHSIIVSGEVGVKKPNPQIFSFAFEQTRLKPDDIVYVGDTTEDMLATLNAGVNAILIHRDQSINNDLYNDFYVNRFNSDKEKLNLINKIEIISDLRELVKLFL